MKLQKKGAVPVQIAPLLVSQPRNPNESIAYISNVEWAMYLYFFGMHLYY